MNTIISRNFYHSEIKTEVLIILSIVLPSNFLVAIPVCIQIRKKLCSKELSLLNKVAIVSQLLKRIITVVDCADSTHRSICFTAAILTSLSK